MFARVLCLSAVLLASAASHQAVAQSDQATTIIEFSASSCPACRQMKPVVAAARAAGIPIQHVDVSVEQALAAEWQVQQIPTYVAVRDGREVNRLVGTASLQQFEQLVRGNAIDATIRGQSEPARPSAGSPMWNADAPPPTRATFDALAAGRPHASNASPSPGGQVAESLAMAASVRLRVEDPQGQSFGTGTVIDMHGNEALVLTCGHIFREAKDQGRIICESAAPGAQKEAIGTLISYDLRRDVALVSFQPGVAIQPAPVGSVADQPKVGDPVFSIGCNHGQQPSFIKNRVLAVNRYHGPANLVVGGRPVDGRSGGGLFNARGVLIGVCNAADQQADEGVYAALGPIHNELDSSGLDYVYRGGEPNPGAPLSTVPSAATRQPISHPTPPQNDQLAVTPPSAEVIYIWRGPEPNSERKVVVIDHPSEQLLRNLNAELNRRGPHAQTRMHVPRTR